MYRHMVSCQARVPAVVPSMCSRCCSVMLADMFGRCCPLEPQLRNMRICSAAFLFVFVVMAATGCFPWLRVPTGAPFCPTVEDWWRHPACNNLPVFVISSVVLTVGTGLMVASCWLRCKCLCCDRCCATWPTCGCSTVPEEETSDGYATLSSLEVRRFLPSRWCASLCLPARIVP